MVPSVRHPAGVITPTGSWRLLRSAKPHVGYISHDGQTVFNLMGPLAAPFADRQYPHIALKEMKGIVPPWKAISQKGATQDGESFVTALYDPLEFDLVVDACGNTPAEAARVLRDWIASWDAIKEGELFWHTPQLGRWWAKVRWAKNPTDNLTGGSFRRQRLTLPVKAYDGFWRSYDNTDQFRFAYATASDEFNFTTGSDLGANWTVAYSGAGSGAIHADGSQVVSTLTGGRAAVARRVGYTSASDNQVVEQQLGILPTWFFDPAAYNDLWARMNTTGTPGTDGIRLRITNHQITISAFVSGTEHVLRQRPMIIPPLPNETWSLVCGFEDDVRHFQALRDGVPIMNVVENGTTSLIGSTHRGAGFGMANNGTHGPASVKRWSAGDNATITQTGFLRRVNAGDQPMFDRYTVYGPGIFTFADGPNSSDTITFGPLLAGQIAQIRTDPRKRSVVDLTSTPANPQQANQFAQALEDFISFATGNNVPPLLQEIESLFGIQPPQGNMYALLQGRFSDAAAIPPKPTGQPASEYHVKVTIDEGNAASRIVAAGTPLRRWPY